MKGKQDKRITPGPPDEVNRKLYDSEENVVTLEVPDVSPPASKLRAKKRSHD